MFCVIIYDIKKEGISMLNNIKKKLYFTKANILLKEGIKNGEVMPFDDDFYNNLKSTTGGILARPTELYKSLTSYSIKVKSIHLSIFLTR